MGKYDRTEMGGQDGAFETTHWTEILRARTLDENRRQATMDKLLGRYWKPVYCYLRRKGHDNEAAKDLTQGFFQEVVLGRDLVQKAESQKGRFRTFLLTALDHYVTSVYRADAAKKRRPKEGLVSLEGTEGHRIPEPAQSASPADAFNHAWAAALLDDVLGELEKDCVDSGKEAHWRVFVARVVEPTLENARPTPLPELCKTLGIDNEVTASNMIITAKRRFRAILRRRIRGFVNSDDEIDEEIGDLVTMLSAKSAG